MDTDRMKGNWTELKGKIREKWGKLTDDEIDQAQGNWEQIKGRIQKTYGYEKDRVDSEVDEFRRQYDEGRRSA